MDFVHLNLHTEYSLLSSAVRISELFTAVKEAGMRAVAMTDKNVLYAAVKFYQMAEAAGVKAIIGCELSLSGAGDRDYSLLLLVKNTVGYQHLIRLVSYNRPVTMDELRDYSEGLIALSAGLEGEISNLLLANQTENALALALKFKEIYGEENFYLELQDHGLAMEKRANLALLALAEQSGLGIVATNAVVYLNAKDSRVQAALLAVKNGEHLDHTPLNDQYYLKSPKEMMDLFAFSPAAISNSVQIAEACHFKFDFNSHHLPTFALPKNMQTASDYLLALCETGLQKRYPLDDGKARNRMMDELNIINMMGFANYFLIVSDFVKFAKDRDILVGPCRGSAGGSIVAYLLAITEVDPLKYGLIFERFLNPERLTMPDIDIDFQDDRRQEVIDYVIAKYGKDHVAQIITFGTLGARAAIRDMGRVLDLPYPLVDSTAKQIEQSPKITIDKAMEHNSRLRQDYQQNSQVKYLIDMAKSVEGFPRHISTHAAGVLISTEKLVELIPLSISGDSLLSQYDMEKLEQLGLLKIDFLGLTTLTVIKNCLDSIARDTGVKIDLNHLDYNDKESFALIARGNTLGLFQLESTGMVRFLRAYKPSSLEDVIAAISLYRPGPMDSIDKYVSNKNNPGQIQYITPELKPILDLTYGCLVYQEQVMEIVRKLAGYSYGRSDLVRRAMSKKKMDLMAREREIFIHGLLDDEGQVLIDGCVRRGISESAANAIFDDMMDFAKYAFNKSHAAGYAMIAYQTAYLKAHYPVHFYAASLSSNLHSAKKIAAFIQEAKQGNIDVLPPDVQYSFAEFSVEDKKIRFGLLAIKNVGKALVEDIIKARRQQPFVSVEDFVLRISRHVLTKNAMEALIKAGALDCFGKERALLLHNCEDLIQLLQQRQRTGSSGQLSLMDEDKRTIAFSYRESKALSPEQRLNYEREVMSIDFAQSQKLYLRMTVLNKQEANYLKSWANYFHGRDQLFVYQERNKQTIVYAQGIAINEKSMEYLKKRYGSENLILKKS